ncbi:MAG: hypothetical protein ACLUUF_00355 [Bifidobacterium pullorum]
MEAERDDLRRRIEELERILVSADELDRVVVSEMDDVADRYGSPRRTVLLDVDPDGSMHPVTAAGAEGVPAGAMEAVRAAHTVSSAEADVAAAAAARKAGEDAGAVSALQLDDEPCVVMMSASGLGSPRTSPAR